MVSPGAKLKPGRTVHVAPGFDIEIVSVTERRTRLVRLMVEGSVDDAIERYGHVPLPPYIERPDVAGDGERYQTIYARERGSVAAPTAGLHFTPALLDALAAKGVGRADVGRFFTIYAKCDGLRLAPAWLDGREVIAVFEDQAAAEPSYFMWLEWRDGRISFIHDYRHARYVAAEAALVLAPA